MGRVIVAGSINMDVVARAARHPRIGETISGDSLTYSLGGKGANQAVAATKLGAATVLIGRIGDDAFGRDLSTFLSAQDVDVTHVRRTTGVASGAAVITVAGGDNSIVVIPGANARLTPQDVAEIDIRQGDIAVSQFEIPLDVVSAFFAQARAAGATTVLNPTPAQPCPRELLARVDVLVLNETELALLSSATLDADATADSICLAAERLDFHGNVVVTLGARGAVALTKGEAVIIPGRNVTAVDTTGAGDCFVGALAARLGAGTPFTNALAFANAAASICVQRPGAAPSMPTLQEVEAAIVR